MSKKRKRVVKDYDQPDSEVESKHRVKTSYIIDPEEIAELIRASHAPYVDLPSRSEQAEYPTYTEEETQDLISGKRRKRKKYHTSESK